MITVKISDYVAGRYNKSKLEKLKAEIEKELNKLPGYIADDLKDEDVIVLITMSAKYQDLYVKVSGYKDNFQRLGYIEEAINEALEQRVFESCEAEYADEIGSFKIEFE